MEHGGVKLTLLKTEVTRLLETEDLGIAIQTQDPRRSIWVPSVLNGYAELRARLAAWVPVEVEEPLQDDRHLTIRGHSPVQWILAFYPAALLVRSPYFAIPLTTLITAYLLNLTRGVYRQSSLPDGTNWTISPAAWLIPLALVVPLIVKLVFVLR
jgi:hypothetical protein